MIFDVLVCLVMGNGEGSVLSWCAKVQCGVVGEECLVLKCTECKDARLG